MSDEQPLDEHALDELSGSREPVVRAFDVKDVEIRRGDSDGREVVVRAVTYNRPYRVSDDGRRFYNEVWKSGVFNRSMSQRENRIPILLLHDKRKLPVGATQGVEGDGKDAFVARTRISKTVAGDEALELINDGALTGVSVGAVPLVSRTNRGAVERVEARLNEISLTPFPQMDDAGVVAVRSAAWDDEADETAPVQTEVTETVETFTELITERELPHNIVDIVALEQALRSGELSISVVRSLIDDIERASMTPRRDEVSRFLDSLTLPELTPTGENQ